MKRFALFLAILAVPVCAFAQSIPYGGQGPSVDATGYGGIDAGSFGVKDAVNGAADDTLWGISATADFDSSAAFTAVTWDNIFVQAYFIGGGQTFDDTDTVTAAGRDSNNVRIYHMGSVDGISWTLVDSTSVTDTVVTFDAVSWPGWPWYMAIIRGLDAVRIAQVPGAAGWLRIAHKGAK